MRFDFVVLVMVLNGCVCLQPVDEVPDSGSNEERDSGSPATVTSFIAKVPIEDLAERNWEDWQFPPSWQGASPVWRLISWGSHGEMFIDAVGGIVLPDAGYVSAATPSWREASHRTLNQYPGWTTTSRTTSGRLNCGA